MLTYSVNGQASALVTERVVLLIDMPLDEANLLWDTVCAPNARMETVLTELLRQGVSNLRDFVLAELVDPTMGVITVAVRGRGAAEFGSEVIEGNGVSTWIEHTKELVMSVKLTLDTPSADALVLPIDRGIVQTQQLVWGTEAPSHFSETVAVRSSLGRAPEPALFRDVTHTHAHTIVTPETREAEPHTLPRTVSEPVEELTVVRRAIPRWMLRFTSGKVIGIGERVVVGRRPSPTISAGEQLETLLSPQREVSSNHALLIGSEDGVQIIDLRSTNGTEIRRASGEIILVQDGNAAMLHEGDRAIFGDGNEAECVRASHPRV